MATSESNLVIGSVRQNLSRVGHVSKVLEAARIVRETFDVKNEAHRTAYLVFLKTGVWTIKFNAEWPDLTVTGTIDRKLVREALETSAPAADQVILDKNLKPITNARA